MHAQAKLALRTHIVTYARMVTSDPLSSVLAASMRSHCSWQQQTRGTVGVKSYHLYSVVFCLIYFRVVTIIETQFLSNRSQHVLVDSCRNKLVNVVSGVPQGSVLDPLVSLLYTSERFSILENKLIGYADDSTLIAVVPSPGIRVAVACRVPEPRATS